MSAKDPNFEDIDSESEEWVLVPGEELEDSDLSSSFVDLQDDDSTEPPQSESDVAGKKVETLSQPDLEPKTVTQTEQTEQTEAVNEPSVSQSETGKSKTSYAEVLRKANQAKPSWTPVRNGKTRVKRKKGRSVRPQSIEASQTEKKTQRRGSCSQQLQKSDTPVSPPSGHPTNTLALVY
jgi:hypothetical protein